MRTDPCFDVSTYEQMLAGQLPAVESEKVCEHLERCNRCCQVLRKMPEDSIAALMRAKGAWPTTAADPTFIRDLVQKVLLQSGPELPKLVMFACPGCGKKLQVKKELVGRKVQCPSCHQVMPAPTVTIAPKPASASITEEDADASETLPPRAAPSEELREAEAATLPPTYSRTPMSELRSGPAEKSAFTDNPPEARVVDEDGPLPSIPGYEVLGTLGRGGMGVVYKARHQKLNRLVALKMILAGSHAGAADLARFQTEAEAIARLQHPNIVQVHEIGEHEGKPFFSLEFCGGGSLAQKLGGTPLPAREAAELVETLARAMQAAHDQYIIHRDLKPANVLLTKKGVPKITDFGLAKKLDEAGQTQAGAVMGTPSYMAPEQAGGESGVVGPLADVYTLGAILYECLTGRPPFKAANSLETIMMVVSSEPVPPRELNPRIPRDLETICLKCLEKDPHKRYASAANLGADLAHFEKGEPISARPVGRIERSWRWCRRNPVVAGLLALVALVAVTGAAAVLHQLDRAINAEAEERQKATLLNAALGRATEAEVDVRRQANDLTVALGRTKEAEANATKKAHDATVALGRATEAEEKEKKKGQELSAALVRTTEAERQKAAELARAESLLYLGQIKEAHYHFLNNDPVRCRQTLDQTRWDLRRQEYGYLVQQLNNKVRTLDFRGQEISALALSPDGKYVFTGSHDGILRKRDLATGREEARQLHGAAITDVVLTPDGKRLYSRDSVGNLHESILATGQSFSRFTDPDLKNFAVVPGSMPLLIERTTTNTHFRGADPGLKHVRGLAMSADGKRLATWIQPPFKTKIGRQFKILDLTTKGKEIDIPWEKGVVHSLTFSSDGKTLFAASQTEIKAWDVGTGKEIYSLRGHAKMVRCLAMSRDGKRLFSAAEDATIKVWDVESAPEEDEETPALLTFAGHEEEINCLALSPDQKHLFSGSMDGSIKVWDAVKGNAVLTLQGHSGSVLSLAVAADGKRLVSGSRAPDHAIKVWNLEAAEPPGSLRELTETIRSQVVAADGGRVFSGGQDATVRVRDGEGNDLATLRGHSDWVGALAASADGKRLASSLNSGKPQLLGKKEIKVWDVDAGTELFNLPGDGYLALSPDGKRLFSSGGYVKDPPITMWDLETGKELLVLRGHKAWVTSLAVSPDGKRIFSADRDLNIKVWDLSSGKEIRHLTGHDVGGARHHRPSMPGIHGLAVSPDGKRLFSGSHDECVKVWDLDTGDEIVTLRGHTSRIISLAITGDGKRLFSSSHDRTIILWDLDTFSEILRLPGHASFISALGLTGDGKRLISAGDEVKTWNLDAGRETLSLPGHVDTLLMMPDGRRLFSLSSAQHTQGSKGLTEGKGVKFITGDMKIWDLTTGREVMNMRAPTSNVHKTAVLSADGKRLFTAGGEAKVGGEIKAWDLPSGTEIFDAKVPGGMVTSLALSSDGTRLYSGSGDGTIKTWHAHTGKEIATLPGHGAGITSLALAADGKRLYSAGSDSTIKTWNPETGELTATLRGHAAEVTSLALSADGQKLFSGSRDATIKVWDLPVGKNALTLRGHQAAVMRLAMADNRLFSGCADGTIKVWQLGSARESLTLGIPQVVDANDMAAILALAVTADGKHVFSHTRSAAMSRVWDVEAEMRAAAFALSYQQDNGQIAFFLHDQLGNRMPITPSPLPPLPGGEGEGVRVPPRNLSLIRLDGKDLLFGHLPGQSQAFTGQLTSLDPKDVVRKKSPHKVHVVKLSAGTTYTIDMRARDFDAFLRLEDPAGKQLAEDDDSGGGQDARIIFMPKETGEFRIIATSFDEKIGGGVYRLSVRVSADPDGGAWPLFSESLKRADGSTVSIWSHEKVEITQTVRLIRGNDGRPENCLITYRAVNKDDKPHLVGFRNLIDVSLVKFGTQPFALDGKLITTSADFQGQDVPASIRALQFPDLKNPRQVVFLSLKTSDDLARPDRLVITQHPGPLLLKNWDIRVQNMFREGAVVIYWNPVEIPAGGYRKFGFAFGLSQYVPPQ